MAGFLIELEDNGVLDYYWKHVADLGSARARRIYSMAMNRKGRQGYTQIVRAIAKQTSIKQKDVRSQTTFRPSTASTLTTTVRAKGRHFSLKYFKARQFSYGTAATVWGRRQQFHSAFIHAGQPGSGKLVGGGHVFRRTGPSSNPIEKMFGPSIPVEMLKDDSVRAFERNAREIMVEVTRLIAAKI